jgi:hypothetical protein
MARARRSGSLRRVWLGSPAGAAEGARGVRVVCGAEDGRWGVGCAGVNARWQRLRACGGVKGAVGRFDWAGLGRLGRVTVDDNCRVRVHTCSLPGLRAAVASRDDASCARITVLRIRPTSQAPPPTTPLAHTSTRRILHEKLQGPRA